MLLHAWIKVQLADSSRQLDVSQLLSHVRQLQAAKPEVAILKPIWLSLSAAAAAATDGTGAALEKLIKLWRAQADDDSAEFNAELMRLSALHSYEQGHTLQVRSSLWTVDLKKILVDTHRPSCTAALVSGTYLLCRSQVKAEPDARCLLICVRCPCMGLPNCMFAHGNVLSCRLLSQEALIMASQRVDLPSILFSLFVMALNQCIRQALSRRASTILVTGTLYLVCYHS